MFSNLLESTRPRRPLFGGGFVSGGMHVLLIWGAVVATANAGEKVRDRITQGTPFFVVPKPRVPEPAKPQATDAPITRVVKGFQTLIAPVDVPDAIPVIDLTKAVTNPDDFTGTGTPGGFANGVTPVEPVEPTHTYQDFEVQKPVVQVPSSAPPRYPELLKAGGVEGEVLVEFIVDSTGRAEPSTLKVLKSTHELFALAVKNAMPGMRFLPAEVDGRRVKQWVRQPFMFAIQR
ncbi:MAG: TonB family protein [Gemmatimonadetes bacterium]|nr:TonB family protein [Gemmatimonadota bacterium]